MPGRGPAPKPADQKVRRNKEHTVEVAADGKMRGVPLPKSSVWPAQTLAWWGSWRRSAQATTFTATDWDFLLETAMLHARFWEGDTSLAGELRLRVAKFGATPEDRMRLKMSIVEATTKAVPPKRGKRPELRLVDPQAS